MTVSTIQTNKKLILKMKKKIFRNSEIHRDQTLILVNAAIWGVRRGTTKQNKTNSVKWKKIQSLAEI